MKKLLIAANILCTLFITSCDDEKTVPKEYIQPEKMVDILTDIALFEGQLQSVGQRDTIASLKAYHGYQFIYYKFRVDSVKMRKSWDYYATHPEAYDDVQEKIVEKLNKMR